MRAIDRPSALLCIYTNLSESRKHFVFVVSQQCMEVSAESGEGRVQSDRLHLASSGNHRSAVEEVSRQMVSWLSLCRDGKTSCCNIKTSNREILHNPQDSGHGSSAHREGSREGWKGIPSPTGVC